MLTTCMFKCLLSHEHQDKHISQMLKAKCGGGNQRLMSMKLYAKYIQCP